MYASGWFQLELVPMQLVQVLTAVVGVHTVRGRGVRSRCWCVEESSTGISESQLALPRLLDQQGRFRAMKGEQQFGRADGLSNRYTQWECLVSPRAAVLYSQDSKDISCSALIAGGLELDWRTIG